MKKVMLVALALGLLLPVVASERIIDIYKFEHCECCSLWGKAMEEDGSKVRTHVMNDQALSVLKKEHSAPAGLRSCYTAVADELVIEGRVPATTIYQTMQSGSGIYGLATPGIPAGSPGMKMSDWKEAYDVVTSAPDGDQGVFQGIE